jgi:E3 ubiquitin-protein ligase MARCH6
MQVVLVLTLELLVLPAAHGFFIDVCMLPFWGGSIQQRLHLFVISPITWLLVHWAIGMFFLMSVGFLLSLSRRLLRPGAPVPAS